MSDEFNAQSRDRRSIPKECRQPSRGRSLTVLVILAVAIVGVMLFVSNRSSGEKNDPRETAPTTQP